MKLFTFLSDWFHAQHAKHVNKMKAEGKCPACRGTAHISFISPFEGHSVVCPSCNGSGLYSDWEEIQEAVKKEDRM
ncbi:MULTISPECIES: hypothetical protein [Bacillus]|uniref:Methionine aminopeptidase n=2 Tax=Bacillus TaxID=1386 RepID=A0A0M5JGG9_9BACI|nr:MULTISPECIES: hypothetical protein [Bacillus]ALC81539.1 hypothetical protein AM592_07960 [Bacillus gobiensis]MBP1080593.1 DnaJ-class molecular chaperone [Bacillus capparidis]MED1094449.1 hypothetical protein [Bacillus capparidis]